MKITALHNQSLFDIALQHTGTINGVFELATANGKSVTDDLSAGQILTVPENILTDNDIKKYYTAKAILPATAFTSEDIQIIERQEGISVWAVNVDFVIRQ
ncbi:MAG: hypothetical protein Q4G08_11535 [Capnocytophaga sp.]|nr:hypothetical protein [Capnocytophaga sp.]